MKPFVNFHHTLSEQKPGAALPVTPESVPDATGDSMTLPLAVNLVALDAALRYGVAPAIAFSPLAGRRAE